MTTAITSATLIDGTGRPPIADATIVIEGETVIAVGTDIVIPPNARRISARGRWVVPGMIDLHVHFWESARPGAQPTFVADLTTLFPYEQEVQWLKSRSDAADCKVVHDQAGDFEGAAIVEIGAAAKARENVEQVARDGYFANRANRPRRSRTSIRRRRSTSRPCSC